MPAGRAGRNGGHRKHENEHKTGIGVVVEVIRDRHPANSYSVAKPGRPEISWICFTRRPARALAAFRTPKPVLPFPPKPIRARPRGKLAQGCFRIISYRARGAGKVISMLTQRESPSAAPSGRNTVSDFLQRCFRLPSGNFKLKVRPQLGALHSPLRRHFPHRSFARCLFSPMPFCA